MDSPVCEVSKLSFSSIRQASVHTVVSALVNISNGGDKGILATDLDQLKYFVAIHSYNSILNMNYTPLSNGAFQDGVCMSWGGTGEGMSSAYIDFALNSSGGSTDYYSDYVVNITSKIVVNGYYTLLTGASKQLNVTCRLYNEGKPAIAKNFSVYYEYDGLLSIEEWVQITSPSIIDYGNGTYIISSTVSTINRDDPLLISVHSHDLRDILVLANVTCTLS
jgi:hypothetical protein